MKITVLKQDFDAALARGFWAPGTIAQTGIRIVYAGLQGGGIPLQAEAFSDNHPMRSLQRAFDEAFVGVVAVAKLDDDRWNRLAVIRAALPMTFDIP